MVEGARDDGGEVVSACTHMAVSNYGTILHDLGPRPRQGLLRRLGRKRASKVYVDRGGKTFHIGYVVAGEWWTVYEVRRFEREVAR